MVLPEPVQADAHVRKAHLVETPGGLRSDEGAVGGQNHPHASVPRVSRQIQHVRPGQRLSAGEKEHGGAEPRQIVDEFQSFLAGKLALCGMLVGLGVAVHAVEVAAPGDVPHHHGFLVLGELKKVGGKLSRVAPVSKRIRRFHGPAVQFGNPDHGFDHLYVVTFGLAPSSRTKASTRPSMV